MVAASGAVIAVAGLAYLAGSRAKEGPGTAQAAQAEPATPEPAKPAAAPPRGGDPFGHLDLDGLGQKLAEEKALRGKSVANAASVFQAIERKAKIPVGDHLQVLGSSVGARYCERVSTKSDVYVVVCEFADEASATKGVSTATVATIDRREVFRVRDATVAIHRVGTGSAADLEAAKIHDVVAKL